MKSTNTKQILCLVVALIFLLGFGVEAQPTGPGTSPTPFGFLEALLFAGGAYGVRELAKDRKKPN